MAEHNSIDVLNGAFTVENPDVLVLGVLQVVEAMHPDDGEPYLHFIRPTDVPIWKAIGMLEVMLGDLKADCLKDDE